MTSAISYQLSYQANWALNKLRVRNIPIDGEDVKWIYEISCIWTVESVGLIRNLVRALHRYRRAHGFESRSSLNFFQAVYFLNCLSSMHNCDGISSAKNVIPLFKYMKLHISLFCRQRACIYLKTNFKYCVTKSRLWQSVLSAGTWHVTTDKRRKTCNQCQARGNL